MEEKGKKLGIVNLLGLGLGSAIGTGIFIMLGYGIAYTGRSIVLVCAAGCFFMLLAFWYNMAMSSMFVFKAGDYGMRTMQFTPLLTGVSAWFTIIQAFALSTQSIALTEYIQMAVPAVANHTRLVAFLVLTLAFLSTVVGSSFVTRLQNMVTWVLIAALVMFVGFGIGKVDPGAFFSNADGGFFREGAGGFVSALSIMAFACMGTSGLVSVAAVTKKPKRLIPLAMILVTAILAVIYAFMAYIAAGILPYEQVAGVNLSVTAKAIMPAAPYMFFLVGGGICAIGSTLLGTVVIYRYPLLQIAEDGWLPKIFKKQLKSGYPYVGYLAMYVVSAFPILTGMSLEAIVSNIMIPTMLLNLYMNLSCIALPKKYPEQWARRSIKMPVWFWNICSVLGAFSAGVVVYNLFKNLLLNDAIICVAIVVALAALSAIRLKQGAVKVEALEATRTATINESLVMELEMAGE